MTSIHRENDTLVSNNETNGAIAVKNRSNPANPERKPRNRRMSTSSDGKRKSFRRKIPAKARFVFALVQVITRRFFHIMAVVLSWLITRLKPKVELVLLKSNTVLDSVSERWTQRMKDNLPKSLNRKASVRNVKRGILFVIGLLLLLWVFAMYKHLTLVQEQSLGSLQHRPEEAPLVAVHNNEDESEKDNYDDNDDDAAENTRDENVSNSESVPSNNAINTNKRPSSGHVSNRKHKIRTFKPAIVQSEAYNLMRKSRTFHIIQSLKPSKHKSSRHDKRETGPNMLFRLALEQLGYQEAPSPSDPKLLWVVAFGYECSHPDVATVVNSVADVSKLVIFCSGDVNTVTHSHRKEVQDQRLRWLDTNLHRHTDCILYDDFVPVTFTVNPGADLKKLESALSSEGFSKDSRFIMKSQVHGALLGLPTVTDKPLLDIKKLQHQRGFDGIVLQRYIDKPLLWLGRKFTIRTWAVILNTEPLQVLFHDGVIYRSLEDFSNPRKSKTRYARISTIQSQHKEYASRWREAFACMEDLQDFLSSSLSSAEMAHYVDLILKPYLKRMMVFTIAALRRESTHKSGMNVVQHVCFDFGIDSNWNVWLHKMDTNCDTSPGGASYTSPCKQESATAIGQSVIGIAEQLIQHGAYGSSSSKLVDTSKLGLGTLDVLVDDVVLQRSHDSDVQGNRSNNLLNRLRSIVCQRSLYQTFRSRQTFNRRVVQELLPLDGRPLLQNYKLLGLDTSHHLGYPYVVSNENREAKPCPTCGYHNHISVLYCDMCGFETHQGEHGHSKLVEDYESKRLQRHAIGDAAHVPIAQRLKEVAHAPPPTNDIQSASHNDVFDQLAVDLKQCDGIQFHVLPNSDITGHDIEPVRAVSFMECCVTCAKHSECNGFTFIPEDLQCWLKQSSHPVGYRREAVSGERVLQSFATDHSEPVRLRGALDTPSRSRAPFGGTTRLSSSTQVKSEYYRKQLIELFQEHDPSQLRRVDSLLRRYKGNEEKLLHKTRQQYVLLDKFARSSGRGSQDGSMGSLVSPHREQSRGSVPDVHGLTIDDYRSRLVELMQQHEPQEVENVDSLLNLFHGREMELLRTLMDKYHD